MSTTQTSVGGVEGRAPLLGMSAQSYVFLQAYILKESGIVLDESKRYLIEARLQPIVRKEGLTSLDALCLQLIARTSPALNRQVVEAMTTNETLFFRDQIFFDALRRKVLPEKLAACKGKRKIKIWSAAASTGQEAYSVAMLLAEGGYTRSDVEIVGTDLSEQVLERAREGKYQQFEVGRGLPAAYLSKYFTRSGLDWQLRDEIRSMVTFRQMDLRSGLASIGMCDLVLCRNVLIYFNPETKKAILGAIRGVLATSGLLSLGCAETVTNLDTRFSRQTVAQCIFYAHSTEA